MPGFGSGYGVRCPNGIGPDPLVPLLLRAIPLPTAGIARHPPPYVTFSLGHFPALSKFFGPKICGNPYCKLVSLTVFLCRSRTTTYVCQDIVNGKRSAPIYPFRVNGGSIHELAPSGIYSVWDMKNRIKHRLL